MNEACEWGIGGRLLTGWNRSTPRRTWAFSVISQWPIAQAISWPISNLHGEHLGPVKVTYLQ